MALHLCPTLVFALLTTGSPQSKPAVEVPFEELAAVDVPSLKTDLTADQVADQCTAAEKACSEKLAALIAVPDGRRTFDNSFAAYEQAMEDFADAVGRLAFLKDIHPEAKVRAAGAACEERAGKFGVTVGARKDVYLALKAYLDHAGAKSALSADDQRLVTIDMRDFHRNGLDLSDDDRAKLVAIRQRLAELGTKFETNLDENSDSRVLTRAELAGLPESYIGRLKKSADGQGLIVTTKYPDYFPLMENDSLESSRRKMYLAFNQRDAQQNMPLLKEAIGLRDQAAQLLGYSTHADFVTEDRMAKNEVTVRDFLARLRDDLKPRLESDNAKIVELKRAETHDPKAIIQNWDWQYFLNQLKKRDYAIDDEKIRQYFPADKVMAGLFQVYSILFNVKFTEIPGAQVWAPGVALYEVHDGTAGQGKLLAKFYVDLFPREGKYGHAASFPFGVARRVAKGYQVPLSALVVNFSPPENGQVAHLSVEEVNTLFHEFGHVMHASLTESKYASLGGTNVAWDFVEAPSQMLENWVFRPEVLKLVSQDPNDPTQPLPNDLISRIVKARTYDAGIRFSRQVFLATFDQAIHTHGPVVDPDQWDHMLWGQIMGYPIVPEEHFAATFGHLMGGYDAGYYGYLWSLVFASDMFTRFEKEGVLNPKTGLEYRHEILAAGRTREPMALLKAFLGREPNEEAFLRLMGITPAATAEAAQ